jgi:hypothetical protein
MDPDNSDSPFNPNEIARYKRIPSLFRNGVAIANCPGEGESVRKIANSRFATLWLPGVASATMAK